MTDSGALCRRPLPALPARRAGSLRRTMHVDAGPRWGWGAALEVSGAARDVRSDTAGGPPQVLAEVRLRAGFDGERALSALEVDPPASWAQGLLGTRAGSGFRRRLEQLVPAGARRSLLRQVLDDVPAAVLISGYGLMRLARRRGVAAGSLTPPGMLERMTDLCSGWRAGGTATSSVAAGRGVPLQECPPAPEPDDADPWAFHPVGALEADAMRRRRCLELSGSPGGVLEVWATFRDSVGEPGGGEAVLHEYVVRAAVEGGVLRALEAEPRVLPMPECPAAAGAVGALLGTRLEDLPAAVPELLVGTSCCTHLNDLLRALGGLAELAGALGPPGAP